MATAVVRVDQAAIRSLTATGGSVSTNMQKRAVKVESRAKSNARVDTGRMRASGMSQPAADYPPGTWEVTFPVHYSLYQDQGTIFLAPTYFLTSALPAAL